MKGVSLVISVTGETRPSLLTSAFGGRLKGGGGDRWLLRLSQQMSRSLKERLWALPYQSLFHMARNIALFPLFVNGFCLIEQPPSF